MWRISSNHSAIAGISVMFRNTSFSHLLQKGLIELFVLVFLHRDIMQHGFHWIKHVLRGVAQCNLENLIKQIPVEECSPFVVEIRLVKMTRFQNFICPEHKYCQTPNQKPLGYTDCRNVLLLNGFALLKKCLYGSKQSRPVNLAQ